MLHCICCWFCIDVITQKHLGRVFSWWHQVQPHNLYLPLADSALFCETSWMQITQVHLFRPDPSLLYESYDASTINFLHFSCIVMLLQAVSVCCGKDDVLRLQGAGPPSPHTGCSLCWYREKSSHKHLWRSLSTFSYVEKRTRSCEVSLAWLSSPIFVQAYCFFSSYFLFFYIQVVFNE